jgi:ATP/maltotriose-dependent transcriptional regulator MalT
MIVPPLGTVGTVYVEISPKFVDKVAEFHLHALRLLENPAGALTGGTAWAQLGFCALILGDLETAEEVLQKGLNYPTMFTLLERPRLLASSALLACVQNNLEEAAELATQAHEYAQDRQMHHILPFTALTMGQVQQVCGETEACLEACRLAESRALKLGMRPIVWQARATAADALAAAGRGEEAEAERSAARLVVQEIADLFVEEAFREAFLQNATEQIEP